MLYYIFMVGMGSYTRNGFLIKCVIIGVGLIAMVVLFDDMVTPAFQELIGITAQPPEEEITMRKVVIFVTGSIIGSFLYTRVESKE